MLFYVCRTAAFPVLFKKQSCSFGNPWMGENHVNLCTDEQDVHAKVEPEHTDSDSGQAAVQAGEPAHMVNIK